MCTVCGCGEGEVSIEGGHAHHHGHSHTMVTAMVMPTLMRPNRFQQNRAI